MPKNCPAKFYNNCLNSQRHCVRCSAFNSGASKLYYEFVEDLGEHPHKIYLDSIPEVAKDGIKSKLIKRSFKGESTQTKKVAKHLLASLTAGSGRINHDGDAKHLNTFRVEHKERFKSNSLNVSSAELSKGASQKIDIFEIHLVQPDQTYYVLTEKTYLELLSAYAISNSET